MCGCGGGGGEGAGGVKVREFASRCEPKVGTGRRLGWGRCLRDAGVSKVVYGNFKPAEECREQSSAPNKGPNSRNIKC